LADRAVLTVGYAFMAADHSPEEQQDQYPTNQLKREHRISPTRDTLFVLDQLRGILSAAVQ
jgi:hypothetical protein